MGMKPPKKTADMRAYHKEWYANRTEAQKARRRATRRKYYHANPEKTKERLAKILEWRNMNKDKVRRNNLKRYRLTPEARDFMFASQGYACAVCGAPESGSRHHIDHDHDTGVIRSILCHGCNVALGMAKDDPDRLRALAAYIEHHNQ